MARLAGSFLRFQIPCFVGGTVDRQLKEHAASMVWMLIGSLFY